MMKKTMKIAIVLLMAASALMAQNNLLSKAKSSIGGKKHLEDDGITNATHQKYVNQIVWANEKISFDAPDESTFKTKFNAGEHIFARYYLDESLKNLVYKETGKIVDGLSYYCDVYIDSVLQDVKLDYTNIGYDYTGKTTMQIKVHVPKTEISFGCSDQWVEMVNKSMSPGEHTVRVDLRVEGCKTVAATGSFIYVKGTEKVKYGWSLASYPQGMQDATLEADILKCIQSKGTNSGWKEKFSKVRISSTDWDMVYNEYTGVITGRTLDAYCQATWPDGHCTVQLFSFHQQYNGTGYSKTFTFYGTGTQEPADCE
jgi:hypothetical protein